MGTKRQPLIYLREWRLCRGLTQRQLSKRSGVPAAAISKLDNHYYGPLPGTRRKLAEALGIEPDQLLSPPPVTINVERRKWIRRAMALDDGTSIKHAVVFRETGGLRALVTETPEEAERITQEFQGRGIHAWPVVLEGSGIVEIDEGTAGKALHQVPDGNGA